MGFGHIFVDADQTATISALDTILAAKGMKRFGMSPEFHPSHMKQIHETELRLFWISPRLGRWTGIHEFRFYNNENRERWGYTDEVLAADLSKTFEVYRLEVIDQSGFWLWSRMAGGEEKGGGAYQDTPADRSTDPSHPRYELNRIIAREGFKNIGLGYEHIPGPQVRRIENIPHDVKGAEGIGDFVHAAYSKAPLKPLT